MEFVRPLPVWHGAIAADTIGNQIGRFWFKATIMGSARVGYLALSA